jgi:hypothetical protein
MQEMFTAPTAIFTHHTVCAPHKGVEGHHHHTALLDAIFVLSCRQWQSAVPADVQPDMQ